MTVTTIYANANDGELLSSSNTYSKARSGSGSSKFLNANTTAFMTVGQLFSSPTYYCYEGFMEFDTASIADNQAVSAVVLAWDGAGDGSTTDFTAQARAHDWDGSLDTADWVNGANLSGKTLHATWASTGYSTSYSDFTSEAGFAAAISLTAALELIIVSNRLTNGTTPTGAEYVQMRTADTAGTSEDPKLTVTHATLPRLALMGVG